MHDEDRGEAADRHRDSVFYKSGEELYEKHNLVSGADPPVEENEITRTRQISNRNVLIGDRFSLAQRHYRAEIQTGRVHEYTAQNDQTPRDSCFAEHGVTSALVREVSPIILHLHHAISHSIRAEY